MPLTWTCTRPWASISISSCSSFAKTTSFKPVRERLPLHSPDAFDESERTRQLGAAQGGLRLLEVAAGVQSPLVVTRRHRVLAEALVRLPQMIKDEWIPLGMARGRLELILGLGIEA